MTEPTFFEARDGVRLAWRELGEGRPERDLQAMLVLCADRQAGLGALRQAEQIGRLLNERAI